MEVKAEPCPTCPYRKDVPSGVWYHNEYEKLRGYDDNSAFGFFLCHQTNVAGKDIACKGWLMVHQDSVAVRLAQARRTVDGETCFEPCKAELHGSGNAAADFGERAIKKPGRKALKVVEKMRKTGRYKVRKNGIIEATEKFDVHDQILSIVAKKKKG